MPTKSSLVGFNCCVDDWSSQTMACRPVLTTVPNLSFTVKPRTPQMNICRFNAPNSKKFSAVLDIAINSRDDITYLRTVWTSGVYSSSVTIWSINDKMINMKSSKAIWSCSHSCYYGYGHSYVIERPISAHAHVHQCGKRAANGFNFIQHPRKQTKRWMVVLAKFKCF